MKSERKEDPAKLSEAEFNAAMKDADTSVSDYRHVLSAPLEYEGETFKELTFAFGKLTGADSLAIENELAMLNKAVLVPEFSGEYLLRMAVRACTVRRNDGRRLDIGAFRALPLADFVRIRGRARSFLISAGSSAVTAEDGSADNASS